MEKDRTVWTRGSTFHGLACAVVVLLSIGTFWRTTHVGFMLDDRFLVQGVETYPGWTWPSLKADFTESVHKPQVSSYYRPVLSLMVRAEYSLWGRHAFGYHVITILFHALNAVLIYFLIQALGFSPTIALLTAAPFAVHPLMIEDFFAATGGESMANAFLFSSVLAFLRRRSATGWLLAIPAFFAKESNLVLPVLLFLFLVYTGRWKKEYWKALSVLPIIGLYAFCRQHSELVTVHIPPSLLLLFLVKAFPKACFHYLRVIFFPVNMQGWPPIGALSHAWPLYLFLLGAISAAGLFSPTIGLLAIWYILALLPRMPAVMIGNVLMEKWVAVGAPAVFLANAIFLSKGIGAMRRRVRGVSWILLIGFLSFWIGDVYVNIDRRGSDEKNYRWALREGPREFADYRLGSILLETGRPREALAHFQTVLTIAPQEPEYREAFALALWSSGQHDQALKAIDLLAHDFPDNPSIQQNARKMHHLASSAPS